MLLAKRTDIERIKAALKMTRFFDRKGIMIPNAGGSHTLIDDQVEAAAMTALTAIACMSQGRWDLVRQEDVEHISLTDLREAQG